MVPSRNPQTPKSLAPSVNSRPPCDEWGVYDPEQAGLAALQNRLDSDRRTAAEPDAQKIAQSMSKARFLIEEAPKVESE